MGSLRDPELPRGSPWDPRGPHGILEGPDRPDLDLAEGQGSLKRVELRRKAWADFQNWAGLPKVKHLLEIDAADELLSLVISYGQWLWNEDMPRYKFEAALAELGHLKSQWVLRNGCPSISSLRGTLLLQLATTVS